MTPPPRQQEGPEDLERIVLGRGGLPHPVMAAQHLDETTQLLPSGPLGGDPGLAVRVVGEVVERQGVGGEPDVPGVQCIVDQPLHRADLGVGRIPTDRTVQAHDLDAQHRVRDHRHDVGPQWECLEVVEVAPRIRPVRLVGNRGQHVLGDVLHPREAVDDRVLLLGALVAPCQAERAVAHHRGRRPVTDDLGEARVELHLEVDVGVDVQQTRQDPVPGGVHDLVGLVGGEVHAPGDHASVADGDVLMHGTSAVAVEDQSIGHQHVPRGHRSLLKIVQQPSHEFDATGVDSCLLAAGGGVVRRCSSPRSGFRPMGLKL